MGISDLMAKSMPEIGFRLYCVEVGVFDIGAMSLDAQFNGLIVSFRDIRDNLMTKTQFSFCLPKTYEEQVVAFDVKDNMMLFCEVFTLIGKLQRSMDGDDVPDVAMPIIYKHVGRFIKGNSELAVLIRDEAERKRKEFGEPVYQRMLRSSKDFFEFDFSAHQN